MNKRDREQLRASIAKDLVQGQGEHSPTKELLKQYAPLEGVVTTPAAARVRSAPAAPVEKSAALHATVAQRGPSAWHDATEAPFTTIAPDARVERLAVVKGELRVPNTVNYSLFPTLDPFAKAVYYQLFLLSHGFKRDTCIVGLSKLSKSVLMSQRKVQDTITYLERRGLIKRLRAILGGPTKGNVYQVLIPIADRASDSTVAEHATVVGDADMAPDAALAAESSAAPDATNKYDDDEYIKIKSSSKHRKPGNGAAPVENHRSAAPPREIRSAYERATGNRWSESDSEAYLQNGIEKVPVVKVLSVLDTVARRTPAKINSFKYFIKEIVSVPDPRNRAWQKRRLEKIVDRIRDNSVGRAGSLSDFVEDVKHACAREGVQFDNDIFNELLG
ncbi:MAG: hypothetical protein GXX84_05085 [Acidobacteria bacterium]|nr:hypothetical protein [Acidobacteriota bacterium]